MSKNTGKFVWYELMTTDVEAALTFYGEVLGVTAQSMDIGGTPYTMLSAGPVTFAGVVQISDDDASTMIGAPVWVGFVGVDDVDEVASQIPDAGGTVTVPGTDIPGIGRYAAAADMDHAPFMLYQSANPDSDPEYDPGTKGLVGWSEYSAANPEVSLAFYGKIFGWKQVDSHDMGPMGIYRIYGLDGVALGGMYTKGPEYQSQWLYYFIVDEAEAAAKRVQEAGGSITVPPHAVPGGGWIVRCIDAQGANFALMASVK